MRLKRLSFLTLALLSTLAFQAAGCGYGFQNSRSELLEKEGIARIYIRPLGNNSYKPGVENTVYNALVRTVLAHRKVELVTSEAAADAVLTGTISTAQFSVSGLTTANNLFPFGRSDISQVIDQNYKRLDRITVATQYNAVLSCDFALTRTKTAPGHRTLIWTGPFTRSKQFQASNQLDVPGTTSALINESEFERALGDLAVSMMDDLHESMLAMF